MKSFLIIDKATNIVKTAITWGNDKDLPHNYEILDTEYVVELHGREIYNQYQEQFIQGKHFKIKNVEGVDNTAFENIFEEYFPEIIPVITEPTTKELQKQIFDLTTQLVMGGLI